MTRPAPLLRRLSRLFALLLFAGLFAGLVAPSATAQMPREDVVDVPAVGDGLCVSNLFQSHMVLQRDAPIALWGWAAPGADVVVSFGDDRWRGTAGDDRAWRAQLPARPANAEPARLTIQSGDETLVLDDLLIGDVWVLGGQSNMEFELAKVENGALEIASANYPRIRILTVPQGRTPEVRASFPRLHEWSDWFGRHFRKGDWDVCTPEIARDLSAIGFVFARRVHMAAQVPIGVIDVSRGGTTVETWIPKDVLRALDSGPTQAKLAEWDQKLEEWDAQADLQRRIERHENQLKRREEAGEEISEQDRVPPSDLQPGPIADHNLPGSCFAAMMGPLTGLQVRGVLFHQGYNNAFDGMQGVRMYGDLLPVLIREWRAAFGNPQLPFGILSQCTDGAPQTLENYVERMLDTGIHIRATHYEVFKALREAGDEALGFASTYDLRRAWYHPQVKIPAGERIARWALSTQYGFGNQLAWEPPRILSMEPVEGALHLTLSDQVSDPVGGAMTGFAVAGADRRFQPAEVAYVQTGVDDRDRPRYDKRQLLLSSPLVEEPLHYRYAWGRNPLANVQVTGNKDLPLATQRSDDWDMGTVPLGVLDGEELGDRMSRGQRATVLRALRALDQRRTETRSGD